MDENQPPSSLEFSSSSQVQDVYSTPDKGSNLSEDYSPFNSAKHMPQNLRNMVVQSTALPIRPRELFPEMGSADDVWLEAWFHRHPTYKSLNNLVDLKASHPFHGFNYDTLMQRVYQIEPLDGMTARQKNMAKTKSCLHDGSVMYAQRYGEAKAKEGKLNTYLDVTCPRTVGEMISRLKTTIAQYPDNVRHTLSFINELSGVTFEKNGSRYTRSILPDVSVVFEKVESRAKFYLKHAHTNEPIVDQ